MHLESRKILSVSFLILVVLTKAAFTFGLEGSKKTLPSHPIHTYSIVARDTLTGEMGVAVQSHWFSVGSVVPWAEAGVGAVATQSFAEVLYGPLGLELMKSGKTAPEALKELLSKDENSAIRQVAMIDANGNVACHTGDKCIPEAGHIIGNNYSVQANLMLNNKVWTEMASAFEKTKGSLAERMIASLEAGQTAGGDIRGMQSAAIIVVRGKSTGKSWEDKILDLRVEDHPEPLKELKRLYNTAKAYEHMDKGDKAIEENDTEMALKEYGTAEKMVPDNLEMKFWHAVSLVTIGKVDESLPIFEEIFTKDANWAILVKRLPQVDLLPKDEEILEKILSVSGKKK
jgi:uncharacterized Ntn-hydrolase superfamily protein